MHSCLWLRGRISHHCLVITTICASYGVTRLESFNLQSGQDPAMADLSCPSGLEESRRACCHRGLKCQSLLSSQLAGGSVCRIPAITTSLGINTHSNPSATNHPHPRASTPSVHSRYTCLPGPRPGHFPRHQSERTYRSASSVCTSSNLHVCIFLRCRFVSPLDVATVTTTFFEHHHYQPFCNTLIGLFHFLVRFL